MKAKQIYLTGILALVTVIGVSAHDSGITVNDATSLSKKHKIELPHMRIEPEAAQTVDLGNLDQAAMETQVRELSALLFMKKGDLRMTESIPDHLDFEATPSFEALVKQQQAEAQLASWKSNDAAITETDL